ncbi:MAG: alpha/beta fold hydrolase [Candidatus Scalindua sp.]|nr:alpha/beta fold hydrolase [Candidatus Scalindua sp.]
MSDPLNKHNRSRRWRRENFARISRVKRGMIYGTFPLTFLFAASWIITNYLVRQSDLRAPRDSSTGILLGAEVRDLGNYDSTGAVLFVHGFAGGSNNFSDLPDRLAKLGWRVRVMRLPGHGTSPFDFEKKSADELIRAVRNELIHLKKQYKEVVIVGHSMGCALSAVAVKDVSVDKLVFGAPFFGIRYKKYYVLPVETWISLLNPVLRWIHKGTGNIKVNRTEAKGKIFSYQWFPLKGVKTLVEIGKKAKRDEILKAIQSPLLCFHSSQDEAASPKAAHEAFQAVASHDKRLIWVNSSNHHIFWDFDRETVMKETEQFIGIPSFR